MLRPRPREAKQVLRDTQQVDSKFELNIKVVFLGPGACLFLCSLPQPWLIVTSLEHPSCSRGPVSGFGSCIILVIDLARCCVRIPDKRQLKEGKVHSSSQSEGAGYHEGSQGSGV